MAYASRGNWAIAIGWSAPGSSKTPLQLEVTTPEVIMKFPGSDEEKPEFPYLDCPIEINPIDKEALRPWTSKDFVVVIAGLSDNNINVRRSDPDYGYGEYTRS